MKKFIMTVILLALSVAYGYVLFKYTPVIVRYIQLQQRGNGFFGGFVEILSMGILAAVPGIFYFLTKLVKLKLNYKHTNLLAYICALLIALAPTINLLILTFSRRQPFLLWAIVAGIAPGIVAATSIRSGVDAANSL